MKTCTKCKESKPKTEFGPHKHTKDKLYIYCRPCTRNFGKISDAKRRAASKTKVCVKECGTCNWFFDGQCAVKNPGLVCDVDKQDKCMKWESIRREDSEYHFESNYENSMTALLDSDSLF